MIYTISSSEPNPNESSRRDRGDDSGE